MRKIIPALVVISAFLSGCATSFATRPYVAQDDAKDLPGILYYPPGVMRITYAYTLLTDKDGSVQGSATEGTCRQMVQKEELQVLPDYTHPRVFLNTSSPLSSGKVGVSLSQGMITAINVESSPPVAGIATPTGTVAAAVVNKLAATALPACNAGLAIASVIPLKAQP